MDADWRELLRLIPGYDSEATAADGEYFDAAAATTALAFFAECLQFIEGETAGQPFHLQPWQRAIVAALWGWKRADGTRRYRECLIFVPRKNGKTPFAAGLMLLSAFTDKEPGAQLYAAAAAKEQATLIFRHAAGMIAREPELARRSRIYKTYKSIEFAESNSVLRALASDSDNLHGLNASFVVVDELHALPNADLVDVLTTSTGSRRQALTIYITTADFDRPSICNSKHAYACNVRDGTMADSSFLPVIYEATADDDWTDPAVWNRANPNIDVSVKREYLEREYRRAMAEPSYQNTFRRLHLNQKTSQDVRWLSLEAWDACKIDRPELAGRECYGGLDLSTTTDLSAFVLVFPGEPYFILPFFWIPERKLRDKADRVPYATWQRQGLLTVTDGDVVDYDRIRADVVEICEQYNVREVRYDPWNATQLAGQLAEQDGVQMVQMRQGFVSLSGPTKELERRVIGRSIGHDGNPVLRWQMGNVAVKSDPAGNIKPDKQKSTERIDGVVGTVMALSAAITAPPAFRSAYETQGLTTI